MKYEENVLSTAACQQPADDLGAWDHKVNYYCFVEVIC